MSLLKGIKKPVKKEGANIQEKFTHEQPGYITIAGEVFFLDLQDEAQNDISLTTLLFDPSVKGMKAFRLLYLDQDPNSKTPYGNFTPEENKRLITLYRNLFGVSAGRGKKFAMPCDESDKKLLVKSLLLRRVKLIQQINNWTDQVSAEDIQARTLRDQLYALNDLIFNQIPNVFEPCKPISDKPGLAKFSLDNAGMKKLLSIFAFLLAQGKDPLDFFVNSNPSTLDILPRISKKDAPGLVDYEKEFLKINPGRVPDYPETLKKIKMILDDTASSAPTSSAEFDQTIEDIEKSLGIPSDKTLSINDRKTNILTAIQKLNKELGENLKKYMECQAKLEHAKQLEACISKYIPEIEQIEKTLEDLSTLLGDETTVEDGIKKIIDEKNKLLQQVDILQKELNALKAIPPSSSGVGNVLPSDQPISQEQLNEIDQTNRNLYAILEGLRGLIEQFAQEIGYNEINDDNRFLLQTHLTNIFNIVRQIIQQNNLNQQRIAQLSTDLQTLYQDAQATIQTLTQEKDALAIEKATLETQVKDLNDQIAILQATIQNNQTQYDANQKTIADLTTQLNDLRTNLNNDIQKLTQEKDGVVAEKQALEVQIKDLLNQINTLEQENQTLDQENKQKEQQIIDLSNDLRDLQAKCDQEKSQLQQQCDDDKLKITQEKNALAVEKAGLETQVNTLNAQIANLQAENQRLQSQMSSMVLPPTEAEKKRIQDLEVDNDRYRKEIDANTKLIQDLQANLTRLTLQITQLTEERDQAIFDKDDALEKKDLAEQNLITVVGEKTLLEQELQRIQDELNSKNAMLQNIRTLMIQKSNQLPQPILRNDGEDDISFFTRILEQFVPDERDQIFDDLARILGTSLNPNTALVEKRDILFKIVRELTLYRQRIITLFNNVNRRANVVRDANENDIQFFQRILDALPKEECGPFLEQLKISLSGQGFDRQDMTNREKTDDLLSIINAKRLETNEFRSLVNRFTMRMNQLLQKLGLPGNLEENSSPDRIDQILQTINEKIDYYKETEAIAKHALCLLNFFWSLLRNIYRDYESTFTKLNEMTNLEIPDFIIDMIQKIIVTLQTGAPTEGNPREYPDQEQFAQRFGVLQDLVRRATQAGGFDEENRSVGAYIISNFFNDIPNGNAINLQANRSIVLEPGNTSPERVDLGIFMVFLLTYTQKFLSAHQDILREAGCDTNIPLRQRSAPVQPAQGDQLPPGEPGGDEEEDKKKKEDEEQKKKINEPQPRPVVPGPVIQPSVPGYRPLLTECPRSKRKVLFFNPNLEALPLYITTAQEQILQAYPFCMNVDVISKQTGEKIAYSPSNMNKVLTNALRETFGEKPPDEIVNKYRNLNMGIFVYKKDGKITAHLTPAASGGGDEEEFFEN